MRNRGSTDVQALTRGVAAVLDAKEVRRGAPRVLISRLSDSFGPAMSFGVCNVTWSGMQRMQ